MNQNLIFETIPFDKAKERISEYSYGIVHMMSDLQYGEIENLNINWDELLEMRMFSDKGELRIYQTSDGVMAQYCTETADVQDDVVLLQYELRNGKKLKVKEYLEPDEDGQAIIVYTRPYAIV